MRINKNLLAGAAMFVATTMVGFSAHATLLSQLTGLDANCNLDRWTCSYTSCITTRSDGSVYRTTDMNNFTIINSGITGFTESTFNQVLWLGGTRFMVIPKFGATESVFWVSDNDGVTWAQHDTGDRGGWRTDDCSGYAFGGCAGNFCMVSHSGAAGLGYMYSFDGMKTVAGEFAGDFITEGGWPGDRNCSNAYKIICGGGGCVLAANTGYTRNPSGYTFFTQNGTNIPNYTKVSWTMKSRTSSPTHYSPLLGKFVGIDPVHSNGDGGWDYPNTATQRSIVAVDASTGALDYLIIPAVVNPEAIMAHTVMYSDTNIILVRTNPLSYNGQSVMIVKQSNDGVNWTLKGIFKSTCTLLCMKGECYCHDSSDKCATSGMQTVGAHNKWSDSSGNTFTEIIPQ